MRFTISNVARSLADYLAPSFPGAKFYEDPNQQGTTVPCFFLQQRGPAKIENKVSGRFMRTISLDMTYLEDYNLTDLQARYQAAAEKLDELMELFPYVYTEGSKTYTARLRAYDRSWDIDLDALHYKFELRVWVNLEDSGVPMRELEYNEVAE